MQEQHFETFSFTCITKTKKDRVTQLIGLRQSGQYLQMVASTLHFHKRKQHLVDDVQQSWIESPVGSVSDAVCV